MGRLPCCDKVGLRRGRWAAEEDEILVKYIQANGEGSWRALPKKAGLLRCGKSCRLRWFNYLRADLKRGNFTREEDEKIVKLHASLGNRWSLIARHLPGRTDNEIKNYWNAQLSRKIYSFRHLIGGTAILTTTTTTTSMDDDAAKMSSTVNNKAKRMGGRVNRAVARKYNKNIPTNLMITKQPRNNNNKPAEKSVAQGTKTAEMATKVPLIVAEDDVQEMPKDLESVQHCQKNNNCDHHGEINPRNNQQELQPSCTAAPDDDHSCCGINIISIEDCFIGLEDFSTSGSTKHDRQKDCDPGSVLCADRDDYTNVAPLIAEDDNHQEAQNDLESAQEFQENNYGDHYGENTPCNNQPELRASCTAAPADDDHCGGHGIINIEDLFIGLGNFSDDDHQKDYDPWSSLLYTDDYVVVCPSPLDFNYFEDIASPDDYFSLDADARAGLQLWDEGGDGMLLWP